MKIGDIAQRTGLTAHTIRYYERIGLLPAAPRDATRQRVYDASIFTWIDFLGRLKTTGMSIQEMLRYAELRAGGAETEADRSRLLVEHRNKVRSQIAELQACVLVLDTKIAGYIKAQQGTKSAKHDESTRSEPRKSARQRQAASVRD